MPKTKAKPKPAPYASREEKARTDLALYTGAEALASAAIEALTVREAGGTITDDLASDIQQAILKTFVGLRRIPEDASTEEVVDLVNEVMTSRHGEFWTRYFMRSGGR